MKKINICWIIPQYTQLKLIPGKNSPLKKVINDKGTIISYDGQVNYPHSTAIISTARQLQSALGKEVKLKALILNLAAVPRQEFIDNNWQKNYLEEAHKTIKYGKSIIECRRIGLDISKVPNLDKIIKNSDLIAIPISFETHVPELKRLVLFLKQQYNKKIITSGTGVEGHEEELLKSGFDIVFNGTISDKGEEVLESLVNNNYEKLVSLPGVNSNLGNNKIRNLGARNFRRPRLERLAAIKRWKLDLPKYKQFVDVEFEFVGRPDLKTKLNANPVVEYCCAMQDLDYNTVTDIVKSRGKIVFAADEFFLDVGCPRTCNFCHAAGKGNAYRKFNYSIKLLDFYKSLGVTDLIPTDDQVLFRTINNKDITKQLISIYQHTKNLGFTFFYGNGIETYALAEIVELANDNTIFKKLLNLFVETASYIHMPYENIFGLSENPKKSGLTKLSKGIKGFETVLKYLNNNSQGLEIGTNIIFDENTKKQEINKYYKIMDKIATKYQNLILRYNGFFMIPSNCAPHICKYKEEFDISPVEQNPELKIISIPLIRRKRENLDESENILALNIKARNNSRSRRKLSGGTYAIS